MASSSSSTQSTKEPRKEIENNNNNNGITIIHYYYPPESLSDFIIKLKVNNSTGTINNTASDSTATGEKKSTVEGGSKEEKKEGVIIYYHVHSLLLQRRANYFQHLSNISDTTTTTNNNNNNKSNEKSLSEMELLDGVNTTELLFKDYLCHIYFSSRFNTRIRPDTVMHYLHLSRYFDDITLSDDCIFILCSDDYEKSLSFPRYGLFELLSIAYDYKSKELASYCIKRLKDSVFFKTQINRIRDEIPAVHISYGGIAEESKKKRSDHCLSVLRLLLKDIPLELFYHLFLKTELADEELRKIWTGNSLSFDDIKKARETLDNWKG